MKRKFSFFSACLPVAVLILCAIPVSGAAYADLPSGALSAEVEKAVEYGLMNGFTDSTFGYSATMSRAQFVTVLDRLLLSDAESALLPAVMGLPDNLPAVYRDALSRAVACGTVDDSIPFRAYDPVTREEMSEMLVRALGLNEAAQSLSSSPTQSAADAKQQSGTPFEDLPPGREGYASIAYAIGMTKGTSDTTFNPDSTATRAQAAAMFVRIYEKLHQPDSFLHGFQDLLSDSSGASVRADVVSVTWSRMTWSRATAQLQTEPEREEYIPSGSVKTLQTLSKNGVKLHMNVFMDASDGVAELLSSENGADQAVQQILRAMTNDVPEWGGNPYSGVTIDFQDLRAAQKEQFTAFLMDLAAALAPTGKELYVCVPPYPLSGGYDGYDYRAITRLADKIILTAYAYRNGNLNNFLGTEAYWNAAPSSASDVYLSLLELKNASADTSKLVAGFRFQDTAWEIREDGALISGVPLSLGAAALKERLAQANVENGWSVPNQMPYATYYEPDGARYFVWYENEKSLRKKTEIARLLGVTSVSYWHPGPIPPEFQS